MNNYEFEDLDPIDYLKALKTNSEKMERLKEEKMELVEKAVEAGYKNAAIGKAINQSEAGVRMYRLRNNLR